MSVDPHTSIESSASALRECFRWKVIMDANAELDARAWWLWIRAGSLGGRREDAA